MRTTASEYASRWIADCRPLENREFEPTYRSRLWACPVVVIVHCQRVELLASNEVARSTSDGHARRCCRGRCSAALARRHGEAWSDYGLAEESGSSLPACRRDDR